MRMKVLAVGLMISCSPVLVAVPTLVMGQQQVASTEELRAVNEQLSARIAAISEVAPSLIETSNYEFSSDDELQNLIQLMEAFRNDLLVGGQLRNLLQVQVANTQDIMLEISNDPDLDAQTRQDLLGTFEGQLGEMRDVRASMDRLADEIRQFTQVDAPALRSEARYRRLVDENAQITREFQSLAEELRSALTLVSPQSGGTGGD